MPTPSLGAPREQVLFGHVVSLRRSGARYVMRFDPALLVTGKTASVLAKELTGSADVPNDNLVFDPEHRLLTYEVAATATATVVTNPGRGGITAKRVTLGQLARMVAGMPAPGVKPFEPKNPFWIAMRLGTVVELDQQYSP